MTTVLSFIFVLGVLIFFHELGHFLVAKKVGVRVERFSLGFPPHIFSKQWGETVYSIGIIPLGGYVKMTGENPEDEHSGAANEFTSRPVGQRAAILVAGPLMNYLLAIALFIGIYWTAGVAYYDESKVVIGEIVADGPASMAGFQPDDQVIAVNGTPVSSFDSMRVIINAAVEVPVDFTLVRGVDTVALTATTRSRQLTDQDGGTKVVGEIGISPRVLGYHHYGVIESIKRGFVDAHVVVWQTIVFVKKALFLEVSWKLVGGPIEIARLSGEYADRGASYLFWLMAVLSVNLAVLNLLPFIPILDGGQLLFLFIEKIRGVPLSLKARVAAQYFGIIAVLFLTVAVTYNDILRLLGR